MRESLSLSLSLGLFALPGPSFEPKEEIVSGAASSSSSAAALPSYLLLMFLMIADPDVPIQSLLKRPRCCLYRPPSCSLVSR